MDGKPIEACRSKKIQFSSFLVFSMAIITLIALTPFFSKRQKKIKIITSLKIHKILNNCRWHQNQTGCRCADAVCSGIWVKTDRVCWSDRLLSLCIGCCATASASSECSPFRRCSPGAIYASVRHHNRRCCPKSRQDKSDPVDSNTCTANSEMMPLFELEKPKSTGVH